MGYTKHEIVVVVTHFLRTGGLPDIDEFRESIPEEFRRLVIGPVITYTNAWVQYAFLADGSKEGWDTSTEGNEIRDRFLAIFSEDGDMVVHVAMPEGELPYVVYGR